MKRSTDMIIHPDQLPIAIGTPDVMKLIRCCRSTALEQIRKYESDGNPVIWSGKKRPVPRVNRDAFIAWFVGR